MDHPPLYPAMLHCPLLSGAEERERMYAALHEVEQFLFRNAENTTRQRKRSERRDPAKRACGNSVRAVSKPPIGALERFPADVWRMIARAVSEDETSLLNLADSSAVLRRLLRSYGELWKRACERAYEGEIVGPTRAEYIRTRPWTLLRSAATKRCLGCGHKTRAFSIPLGCYACFACGTKEEGPLRVISATRARKEYKATETLLERLPFDERPNANRRRTYCRWFLLSDVHASLR